MRALMPDRKIEVLMFYQYFPVGRQVSFINGLLFV